MIILNNFNEKALQDYVDKICKNSLAGLNLVKSLLVEEKKSTYFRKVPDIYADLEVLLEFVYLYLQMTYRMACIDLNVEFIEPLMTELEQRCISATVEYALFGLSKDVKSKIKQQAFDGFYARMDEYCKYVKAVPQKDEGAKDTLFWEFGKIIADLTGLDKRIACNYACTKLAVQSLEDLDPKSFMRKVRQ